MTTENRPRIVAHRGSSLRFPENTAEAFAGAATEGADGLEFDVRSSADGHLVIHHDPDLSDGRLISRTTADQLPSEVPALREVLKLHQGMWLNVEIKNDLMEPDYDNSGVLARRVVDEVHHVVGATEADGGDVVVSSFDESTLFHALATRGQPGLAVDGPSGGNSALLGTVGFGFLLWHDAEASPSSDVAEIVSAALNKAVELGCTAIHPHGPMVDRDLVERAHGLDLEVNVWTVDDPGRIVELADLGVDGIITNDPAAGLTALGR